MRKQVIRLTESQLNQLIEESIYQVLYENETDEVTWNQIKQGAKSFFGGSDYRTDNSYRNTQDDRMNQGEHTANWLNKKTPLNLKGRIKAAKTGYKNQGNIDNNNTILSALQTCIDKGYGDLSVKQIMTRLKQSNGRNRAVISKANDNIYKNMLPATKQGNKMD